MQTTQIVGADTALGATPYFNGAVTNTAVLVAAHPAATPGIRPRVLYGLVLYNPANAVAYLQLFNAAAANAVSLNSTTPTLSIAVAGAAALVVPFATMGVRFDAGIVIAATTTATGAGAPSSAMVVNIAYA